MANKVGEHLAALITQIQTKPIIILKYKDLNVLIRNNKRINNTDQEISGVDIWQTVRWNQDQYLSSGNKHSWCCL